MESVCVCVCMAFNDPNLLVGSLRLRVHVYGMSQTCPYDFKNQLVLRVPTRTSDRMSQWFPMNNIRVVLANWIITSACARVCNARASATCVPSVHQMEAVVVGNFYVNFLAQMRTDYSTPVVSLLVGQHYRATRSVFDKKKYSSLSLFAYKVRGYLLWENLAAFQAL